ncbi:transposase [bacterium]|nr:transposase [bacterium]
MARNKKRNGEQHRLQLPKDALSRVNLGQVFAEYDRVLQQKKGIFVRTPAIRAATETDLSKCFFVGRRGTGKTAISYFLRTQYRSAIQLQPQTFNAYGLPVEIDQLRDATQRHFRSLVACFKRALLDEVLASWRADHAVDMNERPFSLERNYVDDFDFDLRMLAFVETLFSELAKPKEKDWLRELKKTKTLQDAMEECGISTPVVLLIDQIDEAWDGSDAAVLFLMALMHACVELSASTSFMRPLLFLRENIFDRVRQIDNEFARLETCVVSLEWTRELLIELVERRLQSGLTTKPALGETWDLFFEPYDGMSSREMVLDYCQQRPRDVLTYCSLAIESAVSRRQAMVSVEDLQTARRQFSESRLKDLGDEYSENFPQLQVVLNRFHGLGRDFTVSGVSSLIQKLLVDNEVRQLCGSWIYQYTTPPKFMQLLYGIGFWGLQTKGKPVVFRSLGATTASPPPIDQTTHAVVHPCYRDALDLPDRVITDLEEDLALQQDGLILDIPEAIQLNDYFEEVGRLLDTLPTIPTGRDGETEYEDLIGRMIELCFYRALTNVEPQSRDCEGRVRRDWIASNRADTGFWEVIRSRYKAVQVVWECKNFEELDADVFQQIGYYLNDTIGRFGLVCFRGEMKNHYYGHLKRLADKDNKTVLLLTERDVLVFLRQAKNGKVKESHLQEIYDRTVRKTS